MLIDKVHSYIQQHSLIQHNDTIIIGLSGGPDSVFLLQVLNALKQDYKLILIAAHLNHEWRADAENDAVFCQQLAHHLNVQFVTAKASTITLARESNGSQEEHGRLLRRQFFEQCAQEYHADKIALAHHRDDQYETFFIRLLRGASLSGLVGMRPQHGLYIRPLLNISKMDIMEYLHHNHIAYLTDPTNIQDTYLRNCIRNSVIPALNTCDQRFPLTFEKTLQQLQETEYFLEELTNQLFTTITHRVENNTVIELSSFKALNIALQHRIIIHWLCTEKVPFTPSQGLLNEILKFLVSPRGGQHAIGTEWTIHKKKKWACIIKGQ